jgi:hypothetical protein
MNDINSATPDISWVPVAQERIDREITSLPEPLRATLTITRERLQAISTETTLTQEFTTWDQAVATIREAALISPDPEKESHSTAIQDNLTLIQRDLHFLLTLYHFQCQHWETRQEEKIHHFAPGPFKAFLQQNPQFGPHINSTTARDVLESIGHNYHRIIHRMGFPFIADYNDKEPLQVELTEELWHLYNKKNNLPTDNRVYQTGTKLPLLQESAYPLKSFRKAFGDFRTAIHEIIESTILTESGRKGPICVPPPETIHHVLKKSLAVGRIPKKREVGYRENWQAAKNGICSVLEKELFEAARLMSTTVPRTNNPQNSVLANNWRQLFLTTEYFREYGAQIYDLWIPRKRLEKILDTPLKQVRTYLQRIFLHSPAAFAHMRQAPPLFEMPHSAEHFEDMDKPELTAYAETHILGKPIPSHTKHTTPHLRGTIQTFAREGISITPNQSQLIAMNSQSHQSLKRLCDKAKFFRANPDIPIYMRQILYAQIQTTTANIQERVKLFEDAGAPRELYVHFLHIGAKLGIQKASRTLLMAANGQERIQAQRAYLAATKEKPPTPPLASSSPKEPTPKKTPKPISPERQAAIEHLTELGVPYERFAKNRIYPEKLLEKVEFMLATIGYVKTSLLNLSLERIRNAIQQRHFEDEEIAQRKLDQLLTKKGLERPDYLKLSARRTLEIIYNIEARGVQFEGEWPWVNGSASQRIQGVEKNGVFKREKLAT